MCEHNRIQKNKYDMEFHLEMEYINIVINCHAKQIAKVFIIYLLMGNWESALFCMYIPAPAIIF